MGVGSSGSKLSGIGICNELGVSGRTPGKAKDPPGCRGGVRDVLTAGAEEAEAAGTLPAATVNALYESGLLALKLPQVLGGAEADLLTQLDVLEAVTRIDASAGWFLLIGSASVGGLGAFLPDEAIDEVFAGGRVPKTCGVAMASGRAVPVHGGYRVSGRWSFASGIRHSQWVSAGAMVDQANDAGPERLTFTVRTSEVEIHDNWHVAGLQGTGSNDFSVSDLFVRKAFTRDPASASPRRGGALYRMGRPGSVSNEHCAFALGLGRRALDEMRDLGQAKRGYSGTSSIASRSLFQRSLGECDLKLRGARALVVDILEEARRNIQHRRGGGSGIQSLPLRWRPGSPKLQHLAAVPPRHQRRGPAPDGQRLDLREPRAVYSGSARCRPHGSKPALVGSFPGSLTTSQTPWPSLHRHTPDQ